MIKNFEFDSSSVMMYYFLQPMTILQQQLKIDGSTEYDSYVNNLSEEMSCSVYLQLQLEGFLSMI